MTRSYDALLLDLDGTLLADDDTIHPETLAALRAAHEAGVHVVLATGRSELATQPVLADLGFDALAVVYNGAAVFCPREGRLIEERVLSDRTAKRALEYAEREQLLVVTMCAGAKYSSPPRDAMEQRAVEGMHGLEVCEGWDLPRERLIRVTYFTSADDSLAFEDRIRDAMIDPVYTTHFRLALLASHRESPLSVVDLHPPCLGKAEAVRLLGERHGVPAARVVAVGDATNDLPMLQAAGLAVGMETSVPEVTSAVDRVIGSNNSGTIGELVRELFAV